MKNVFLFFLLLSMGRLFATGEASTYFEVFVPPNNDAVGRDVSMTVTALYDSTYFEIVDDSLDGDSDDSVSGWLMSGQSYVLFIRENGVNDDAPHRGESATKQDGDYFTITSSKLVFVSQSTNSDWQHDWLPSTNKTSKGTRFFIFSPPTTSSPRDINAYAYEDSTTITIKKISSAPLSGSGYTQVDLTLNEVVLQKTLNIGEDLIFRNTEGRNVLETGASYLIETNKEVTVQYGALWANARDGGGYVPSDNGSSVGELFYFTVHYQAAREQEIRVVSWDDSNPISLDKYVNGVWVNVASWTLDELAPGDWISTSGNVDRVFRISCAPGKKVSVFEANWLETGSPGTSDIASMVSSRYGNSAGTEFLAYMAPPGNENNVTNPFTNTKFTKASHLYLFARDSAIVRVRDANTLGQVIDRTYNIAEGRYADCFLDLAEWRSIYNGDGNPNSGTDRPYLLVESDNPIAVFNTNFNDNWMTYVGTSLPQGFSLNAASPQSESYPGDTVLVVADIALSPTQTVTSVTASVLVGNGANLVSCQFVNQFTGYTQQGRINHQGSTGQCEIVFDSLPNLDPTIDYALETAIVLSINYVDGTPIPNLTIISVENTVSGTTGGAFQQASISTGIVNKTANQRGLYFTQLDDNSDVISRLSNSWSVSFVDFNNDGYDDIFLPSYEVSERNLLYRNDGTGGYIRMGAGGLVNELGSAVSSTWGDYDNDGDEDVFVTGNVRSVNYLYRNEGNGNFSKITTGNISNHSGYCHSATWVDYNNDGWLDLYTVDYMPTRFNRLYHNNGDGTFTEVNNGSALVTDIGASIGTTWSDYDLDGDMDVFLPNANGENNILYRNDDNGNFTRITSGDVVNDGGNSVGSSWGDYDNDGDPDLFVSNAGNQPNFLYQNNGDGTFSKITNSPVTTDAGNSAGSTWADFDNDGDLDLYVTNDQNGQKFLYLNDSLGIFRRYDLGPESAAIGNTFGAAVADIDCDGDLDLFTATHSGEENALFLNNNPLQHNYIHFRLTGTNSNRSAIGARVRIKCMIDGQSVWQTREISAQTGGGAGGQNTRLACFGVENAQAVDSVVVHWPSGYTQSLGSLPTNQVHPIVEENGARISGYAYYDVNQNCTRDSNELGISGVVMEVLPGPFYVTTDDSGHYEIYLPQGVYTVSQVSASNWTQTCPTLSGNHTVNVTGLGQNYTGNDFGHQAVCTDPNLSVQVSTTVLRLGFRNTYDVTLHNNGASDAYQTLLTLTLDTDVVAIDASTPWDSVATNPGTVTYSWKLDTLEALSTFHVYVTDSVSVLSTLGRMVTTSVAGSHSATDCNTADNQASDVSEIVGSVDPNDKLVFPQGKGPEGYIQADDTLTYKIRFQNVGTFKASFVEIVDTLSDHLDLSTLKIGAMSHAGTASITEAGVITWRFDKIELPDSITDEPGSHGYVYFQILPKTGGSFGTKIENTAYIQFDYNPFIQTNTVLNTIGLTLGERENTQKLTLGFAPNPMREATLVYVPVSAGDWEVEGKRMRLFTAAGVAVGTQELTGIGPWELKRGNLIGGLYFVQVTDQYGFEYWGKIIVK